MTTVASPPSALDLVRYGRFRESFFALQRFGHRLLASEFVARTILPADGATASRAHVLAAQEVRPEYHRLFDSLVDILAREGFVVRSGDGIRATARLSGAAVLDGAAVADATARMRADHPEIAEYLPLLAACQGRYFDVMAARVPGNDVLFPAGSAHLVLDLYRDNVQTAYYNQLAATSVGDQVATFARRFPRSTAQVFEVGAGTGATSLFVLDALAGYADRLRYFYTDVGPAFLRMAGRSIGAARPFVDFARYNVESAPDVQGFEPHSMDVVLASNVLHATRRIADTLAHCRALLKPGGVLVINELTHRLDYNTLTFGLAEGWWRYDGDDPRIPGSPLLSLAGWRSALLDAGFATVAAHGVPGMAPEDQVQSLVVATAA